MRSATVLASLAGAAPLVACFVAPPPQVQIDDLAVAGPAAARKVQAASRSPPALGAAAAAPHPGFGFGGASVLAGSLVAGALAAVLGRGRGKKESQTEMHCVSRKPASGTMLTNFDWRKTPAWQTSVNLKRKAKAVGRQKYYRQEQTLRDEGITKFYHKWYPKQDTFNMYKGPESLNGNNPHFPAAGSKNALHGWSPAPLASSAPRGLATAGSFVSGASAVQQSLGSAKKRAVSLFGSAPRAARKGLVLNAHKKAASSTRNQGKKNNPKYYGVRKLQGSAVKAGQLIAKQKGQVWYAGANVTLARNFNLNAQRDGILQWRGTYKHREAFVVPWEFVREKCVWKNPNTLGPKEYEPWMGAHNWGKRHHILKLRSEWIQTEAGQEHLSKKAEKKAKQMEIQARIRAHKKAKRKAKVPQESVSVSDSEAES